MRVDGEITIGITIGIRIEITILSTIGGTGDPEGKDGVPALRLGLEGVGIESRGVVLQVQLMNPIEVVQHETGAKTGCVPIFNVFVNLDCAAGEFGAGEEQLAVMIKIVDADLEALTFDAAPEISGGRILALGDQIEGGAES